MNLIDGQQGTLAMQILLATLQLITLVYTNRVHAIVAASKK